MKATKIGITLLTSACILTLGACSQKEQTFIDLNKTSVTLNDKGSAKVEMKTNKGAKYSGLDADNNDKVLFGPQKTKNGDVTLTLSGKGKYKIKVDNDGDVETKVINVKAASSSSSENADSNKEKANKIFSLNQEAVLADSSTNEKVYGLKVTQADQNFNSHGQSLLNETDVPSLTVDRTKGVQFTINYTNYDLNSFLPTLQYFSVYDDDGNGGEIVNQQDGQDEISSGHSADTHFWANFKKPYSQMKFIEVEYNDQDNGGIVTKFKINLQ